MRLTCERLAIGFVFLLLATAAQAQTYTANLTGAAENPAVSPAGTGTTAVTYSASAHTLRVQIVFSGLTSATSASHIHCCIAAPGNAGVATTLPSFTGFPLGVQSGSMDQTYDLTNATSWNPAFVTANGGTTAGAEAALAAALATSQAYLNIHTANNPGGEIRGFMAVGVPAVPVWMLAVGALLTLAVAYVALRKRLQTA